jgi:uncharacterized damage-inducible protein DinB
MAAELESLLVHNARKRLVTDYAEQIKACLRSLSDEELWWRPNEKANAIGNLVLHLCGSTRFYVVGALGDRAVDRDRPAEFAARDPLSREELLRRLDEVMVEVDQVLEGFEPGRLMESTERTGARSTYAQILLHAWLHFAVHTGQIVYATKLRRAGAIDELWFKTRGHR